MRILFAAAVAAMAFTITPAFADCAGDVKMAEGNVMKMSDAKQKEMAMKDLDMAKKAMMDKKDTECMKSAKMANDAAMMKGDSMMKK
jgi:hypothetical protein